MRMAAVLAASFWTLAGPAWTAAPTGTEKLAAWARLYGVMRWFHPSDAAQQIDWNRLAVHGVRAVRAADTRPDLERTLRDLVAPVGVDWDARLPALLEAAAAAPRREAHHDVLRRLVAEVRDGHGSVTDPKVGRAPGVLPIVVRRVEGRWMVTASSQPEQVQVADVVKAIDGVAARPSFADKEALHSGSPQWRSVGAARALAYGPEGS
jgi:hypothetical protein